MKSDPPILLHPTLLSVLDELSDEQAGRLFKAIVAHRKGEDYPLDQITKIALAPIKAWLDKDLEKYQATCEKRAQAGSKGGKQKVANARKAKQKVAKPSKAKQIKPNTNTNTITNTKDLKRSMSASASTVADEIFDSWKLVMKKTGNTIFNDKRRKAVMARLKEGYTKDQILQAINGCSLTPHNMGANDNGKRYDDLELICRNGSQVERFIENTKVNREKHFANGSKPRRLSAYERQLARFEEKYGPQAAQETGGLDMDPDDLDLRGTMGQGTGGGTIIDMD